MPMYTPASGTDQDLSAYLTEMQAAALRIEWLLEAAAVIEFESARPNGSVTALVLTAKEMAHGLQEALDCVNLPKGELK